MSSIIRRSIALALCAVFAPTVCGIAAAQDEDAANGQAQPAINSNMTPEQVQQMLRKAQGRMAPEQAAQLQQLQNAMQGAAARNSRPAQLQREAASIRSRSAEELMKGLDAPDQYYRGEAAYAIGQKKPPMKQAVPRLKIMSIADPSPQVRGHAITSIYSIAPGDRDLPSLARAVLEDEDANMRHIGEQGLRQLHLEAAAPADAAAASALYARGRRIASTKKDEALLEYSLAIVSDPSLADARLARAVQMYSRARYERTVSDLSKYLELKPDNEKAHLMKASALEKLGRSDELGRELDETIKVIPNSGQARYWRGVYLMGKDRDKEAKADFGAAERNGIKVGADLWAYFAIRSAQNGADINELGGLASHATEIDPRNPRACFARGLYELQAEEKRGTHIYTQAVEWLGCAVKGEPGNATYARYYRMAKNKEDASLQELENRSRGGLFAIDMSGIATAFLEGVNAGGSSYVGGSSSGGGSSGGESSGGGSSGGGYRPATANGGTDYNAQVNQRVEQKLWDMNNPFNRR